MVAYIDIHPENPQPRLVNKTVDILKDGGVIAYPTDSGYAIGCTMGNKAGLERIQKIRDLSPKHHYTLVCRDFSQFGQMVIVDNKDFRLIKSMTPGPYTFILKGTKEVPRMMLNPKKKTVGARIPDHKITLALVEALGEPIMSSSLILPGHDEPEVNGWEVRDEIGYMLDAVVEGPVGRGPTSVIDFTDDQPVIRREGAGDLSMFV